MFFFIFLIAAFSVSEMFDDGVQKLSKNFVTSLRDNSSVDVFTWFPLLFAISCVKSQISNTKASISGVLDFFAAKTTKRDLN